MGVTCHLQIELAVGRVLRLRAQRQENHRSVGTSAAYDVPRGQPYPQEEDAGALLLKIGLGHLANAFHTIASIRK